MTREQLEAFDDKAARLEFKDGYSREEAERIAYEQVMGDDET